MNHHDILKSKIIFMITNDLTIGRSDHNLLPFTDDKIQKFIRDNNDKIENVIQTMIHEYSNDNDLELLKDPLLDWIGEYLYEIIDTMSAK